MKTLVLILLSVSPLSSLALASGSEPDSKPVETIQAKQVFSKSISDDAKIYDGSISAPIAEKVAAQAQIEEPTEAPRRQTPSHRN